MQGCYSTKIYGFAFLLIFCISCTDKISSQENQLIVPLGGNSWVSTSKDGAPDQLSEAGWENWNNPKTVWTTFVYVEKAGTLELSALLAVPQGNSSLQWTINGSSKTTVVTGAQQHLRQVGQWTIDQPGYVEIQAQGLQKSGEVFANVYGLSLSGTISSGKLNYVPNNDGQYFYWGRRGPSVHLNYDVSAAGNEVEWFYNEVTVPVGNDVIGSFFMANGFSEGYFGMQVNGPNERRILFSVWSPYQTDNPKEIPENQKIKLLKKGTKVYAGEFGDEGSGGQSFLQYNWKAGSTYKFLLHAEPTTHQYTNYTAYFYATEQKKWLLIASFSRPSTQTYLKRLHSFLENFEPETGNISRKAYYHNTWIRTKSGTWQPLTKVQFTGDATANKGYRLDYDGGVEQGKFFLRNCGFFSKRTVLKSRFEIPTPTITPKIPSSILKS